MRLKIPSAVAPNPESILTIALCSMLSSWIWLGCAGKATPAKRGDVAAPVTVATVTRKNVPLDLQVVGNVESYLTIMVKPQVGGELTGVHFREGDFVQKGDLLFTVDPRLLQAQLAQVEANLARDEAQLGLIEANLTRDMAQEKYALAQAVRYASLLQNGLISKEEAEQVRTNAEASAAAVGADQAAIRSARAAVVASKAAVENVRVQLGYTSIRSPIDGRTGNQNVKQGNVVTANVTDLVTINRIQPIYVAFSVPEVRRPEIKKSQMVMVSPQGDSSTPETGEVSFVDNTVDSTTGTIRVKGTIPNHERRLWPGEFARVTVRLATQTNVLVVPNQAVQTGQEGSYVYVVRDDRTVESRPVVTGTRVDQDLVIEKGLQPGETVVTEGQLRLAPGIRVQIANAQGGSPKGKSKNKTGVEP